MLMKNKYRIKWLKPRHTPTKLNGAAKWVIMGEDCCVRMGPTLSRCGAIAEERGNAIEFAEKKHFVWSSYQIHA
jgi:hypothetical protein